MVIPCRLTADIRIQPDWSFMTTANLLVKTTTEPSPLSWVHVTTPILIIEPDQKMRAWFTTILTEAGYQTHTVASSEAMLTYLKHARAYLIIADLFLLPQSPLETLAQINEWAPRADVIVTTTTPSVETSLVALRGGAIDYLVKPLEAEALHQAVRRAFVQRQEASVKHRPDPLIELEILRAASELFLKNQSEEEVLSIIGDRALQMSQAGYCEIFTNQPDGKAFVSTIQLSAQQPAPQAIRDESHRLAAEAIKGQKNIIVQSNGTAMEAGQSWLVFPFKVSGNIVGALCLGHQAGHIFSPAIIKLLSIFIDQASIAISNAHLFADLTHAYSKLSRSRAEILASRNTLQTLFDGITDGLYIIDQQLKIIAVNQSEACYLQQPVEAIVGQTFDALGWQEVAAPFIKLIHDTFASGQKAAWIPPEPAKSPLVHNREMHLYPIVSPAGEVQQLIILAQDVTNQKTLQASLFQSANMAAVGQLATSIAHEINNPLTIALTNTQLTMLELNPTDELYEFMEDIYYACNRIKDIVNNLVDFSNQAVYQFEPVNLIETLEDTLLLIGHPLRRAKIEIERVYNATPIITASRSHLKMAWMNLLLNAYEAIAGSKKPGRITIIIAPADSDQVEISITDTGIGISEQHIKNIFNPFFTTKPVGQGVGLGLFTTKTIIEKHNGSISCQSLPSGAVFSTILPK